MRNSPRPACRVVMLSCVLVSAGLATDAAAQYPTLPGQPMRELQVEATPGAVDIRFSAPSELRASMNRAGGVTLLAASAPNGPLFVSLPFAGPFPPPINEEMDLYGWYFPGVPPGTYYVAVVLGLTPPPTVPDALWTGVVIPGPTVCTSVPGLGVVSRELAGVQTDAVRLFLGADNGCVTSYRVEVGTTPGASNVLAIEHGGVLLQADAVPAGSYYVRVTPRNQFGYGRTSSVLPVAVPDCSAEITNHFIDGFRATVNGSQVRFDWTPPVTAPGHPITYYEMGLYNGVGPDDPAPHILLPPVVSTFTTTVPSGTYLLALRAGNACGIWESTGISVTVP